MRYTRTVIVSLALALSPFYSVKLLAADQADFVNAIRDDLRYRAMASGLYAKYDCENYGLSNLEDAIFLTGVELVDLGADSLAEAILQIRITCSGGPQIETDAMYLRNGAIIGYVHKPYTFSNARPAEYDSPVRELVDIRKMLRRDPFVQAVWPILAAVEIAAPNETCVGVEDGVTLNFWNSEYYDREQHGRVSYLLKCRFDDITHVLEFEGWLDLSGKKIVWRKIFKDQMLWE